MRSVQSRSWRWAAAFVAAGVLVLAAGPLVTVRVAQAGGPTDPTCGGVPYDAATEGCCFDSIYTTSDSFCCDNTQSAIPLDECCPSDPLPPE
ncbi:MAG TPA: hypothetical protein VER17_09025 [Tepidisphaeraceae bacterium]|nr:hypothetical protein [Tepidisphaeraceae bacterium]